MKARTLAWIVMLSLAACSRGDQDFDRAKQADTIPGWETYLQKHNDGEHAAAARDRLAALIEDREWDRAHAADSVEAYQAYLRGYPTGRHAHDALVAISNLNLASTPSGEAGPPAAGPAGASAGAAPNAPVRAAASPTAAAPAHLAKEPPAAKPTGPSRAPAKAAGSGPAKSKASQPAPKAAAPAEAAGAEGEGLWRVQLGAYTQGRDAALKAWHGLAAQHAELKRHSPLIEVAKTPGGQTFHRLRVGNLSRRAALGLCHALTQAGATCVLVPPAKTGSGATG